MKQLRILLLVLLLAAVLLGCGEQANTYTFSQNGTELLVDTEHKTISDGINTYQYTYSAEESSFSVTITYPNGASYRYSQSGGFGTGSWSDNYDESTYVDGDTLVDAVQEGASKWVKPKMSFGALILIALGAVEVGFPKVFWYLRYGWRYKDAEPSDAALIFARIGGIVVIILGIMLLWR